MQDNVPIGSPKSPLAALAFFLAAVNFIMTFATRPVVGLFAAFAAFVLALGLLISSESNQEGIRVVSIASLILGFMGMAFAVFVIFGVIKFVTMWPV